MLSEKWNPEPELAKRFIDYEGFCFARSSVDSDALEAECDEPETDDCYSEELHSCNEPQRLRSYADSDADAIE